MPGVPSSAVRRLVALLLLVGLSGCARPADTPVTVAVPEGMRHFSLALPWLVLAGALGLWWLAHAIGRFLGPRGPALAGAGLLALAVLALAAAPSAAWLAMARGGGDHDRRAAALAFHGEEHPDGGHDAPAPAACCAALGCPMLLGDIPAPPAHPSVFAGSPVRAPAAVRRLDGLDIPPDPPPPRRRA